MEYNGARPKEKSDTRLGSDEYTQRRNIGYRSGGYRGRLNMDTHYSSAEDSSQFVRHLSVRLCDVLDKVGASAEFRKLRQDCALSYEIIESLEFQLESYQESCFIFGSSSEGTTTPGLNSDTDNLTCNNESPVVANVSDAGDGYSLLMTRDKHTQSGYVKLQLVYNGQPETVYTRNINRAKEESDGEGRICLKHISLGKTYGTEERNGPADTIMERNCDHVYSFRCSDIPEFSSEWILRKRPYTWPFKSMLDNMARMGCFVVGVGHPASSERNIEWRLSFSLQERELMFSMNLVQHKCYILLKLLKKDLNAPFIGLVISSYHLKTCMFYVIGNTKAKLWKRSHLVQCVFLCLHVLLKWVLEGYCPNYFIKEENMFDRDIHRTQRENVVQHLKKILLNRCEIIFLIKLDCIGDILKRVKRNFQLENVNLTYEFKIKIRSVKQVFKYYETLCDRLYDRTNPLRTLEYLHSHHSYLSQIKCINDHTEQQTQEAVSYIIPFVHMLLAKSYASLTFSKDEIEVKYRLLQSCKYHLYQARHCDMTSSRLLEVTILYKLEQYEQCISLLDQLAHEVNRKPLPICRCDIWLNLLFYDNHLTELSKLTMASILMRTPTCVIFHNSDTAIVPEALQYEIYRSINTQHILRNEHDDTAIVPEALRFEIYRIVNPQHGSTHLYTDRWMELTAVDAEVYLYFMEYLVYTARIQLFHKHLVINKLISVLKRGQFLRHLETGYNILGWIHFNEGWIRQGIQYFRKSWSIRPHHNAAKFHIMFYIFGDRN